MGRAEEWGVVAAASYEARKYGIRSAMSSVKAKRLCPDVIFIPGRMGVYKEVSAQIHEIFHEYTDLVEPISLDEAFLDVTENKQNILLAVDIAKAIKERIRNELHLVASDYRKPDGLCTIHPDQALEFIGKLPIESFWGVGKVTAKKMYSFGIHNGKQLRKCNLEFLIRQFGKTGKLYYDFAHGVDPRPVEAIRIRKSVGCEHTLDKDITLHSSIIIELYHVTTELIKRLERSGFKRNTLTLKLKFNDFTQKTRCISIAHHLTSLKEILPLAKLLLKEVDLTGHPIRLIGLSVSNPREDTPFGYAEQLSFDFK